MNATAIFVMLLTILLVWGGLVASVVLLRVLPDPQIDDAELDRSLGNDE